MADGAKIKVLTFSHYMSLYGANRSLLNLIQGTKNSIEWVVVCKTSVSNRNNPFIKELEKAGVEYKIIPFFADTRTFGSAGYKSTKLYFFKELLENIYYAIKLSLICKRESIRYIHSNSSMYCLGAYVGFLTGLPHVWHFREFIDKDYNQKYHFGIGYLVFWANRAKRIIAISKAIETECIKDRRIKTEASVIYNGVVFESEIPKLLSKTFDEKCKLLIVGTIYDAKNQLEALKALKILLSKGINVELTIAGDKEGLYYEEILKYISSNGLQANVNFTGYVSDTRGLYFNSDITLVCSRNEGMGRVTVESQTYGTPVIGYDAAGTSELIIHMQNGILYKGDETSLADAIEILMKDKELYEQLRINGQRSIKENYTIENYARQFLKVLST